MHDHLYRPVAYTHHILFYVVDWRVEAALAKAPW